jgi:hypothetical protein
MVSFGELYVLLVDWALTIVLLFLVVSILSPLEPENLFPSVKEALEHFVKNGKPFAFACYFWQHKPGEYAATPSWPKEQILCPPWEGVARSMHKEALELDKSLPSTWQGVNSRSRQSLRTRSGGRVQPTAFIIAASGSPRSW